LRVAEFTFDLFPQWHFTEGAVIDDVAAIGDRIKHRRLTLGISQYKVACPYSDSYLSLVESGQRLPSQSVLEHIARQLNCSPNYLLYGIPDGTIRHLASILEDAQEKTDRGLVSSALELYELLLSEPVATILPELHPQTTIGYARALEEAGRFDEAIARLEGLDYHGRSYWAIRMAALVRCYRRSGALHKAESVAVEAMRQTHQIFDSDYVIIGTQLMAAYSASRAHASAQTLGNELITRPSEEFDPRTRFDLLWQLAHSARERDDVVETIKWADQAHSLALSTGIVGPFRMTNSYGELLLSTGDFRAARRALVTLRDRSQHSASRSYEDAAVRNTLIARACLLIGNRSEVVRLREQILDGTARASATTRGRALATYGSAVGISNPGEAISRLSEGARLLTEIGLNDEAAIAWQAISDIHAETGDQDAAVAAIKNALSCADLMTPATPAPPYPPLPGTEDDKQLRVFG
jgi:transcriptional regulator with XRE-family HTH domain